MVRIAFRATVTELEMKTVFNENMEWTTFIKRWWWQKRRGGKNVTWHKRRGGTNVVFI
jgi:hypothetical protein